MSLSSKIGRVLSGKTIVAKAREQRRQKSLQEARRRRVFEALEPRQMLDAASLYETLPEVITIADPDSYHFAYEGVPLEFVDASSVDGLTASFVEGTQIAFSIQKTTEGVVSSLGEVTIQLFDSEAPNSVSHFLSLYFSDYYEGKTFHRDIPGFMFQGGSSDGYGFQGSGTTIADEYSDVLTHSSRGIVAFANSNNTQTGRKDTSDSQFYITYDACSWLDGGYNVFGFVVDGYDVIDQMEAAKTHTVTNPYGTESQNFPVDTFTIVDMHLVSAPEQSALRLVSDKDASGVTNISFTSTIDDDALEFQQTTVYVGEDGLRQYIEAALADVDFNVNAGETISVELPTEFGGYAIKYTIGSAVEPEGYEIKPTGDNNSKFDIVTENYGAQYATISITAKLDNGLTVKIDQPTYISPAVPSVVFESTSGTKVGDLEDGVKIVSSNLADSALQIKATFNGFDLGATTDNPISVYIDGEEFNYSVVKHFYDEEVHEQTYTLSLQLKDSQKLSEGMHTIALRTYVPAFRDGAWTRLYSDYANFDVYVDTKELSFTESAMSLNINPGDVGAKQLHTNKADEEGVERSDIVFALANPEAGPRFISVSETGALSWSNVTADDYGVYYVAVKATDALGNVATMKLTLNVGCIPIFDDVDPIEAKTGEKLEVEIRASVPTAEGVTIKYEIVSAPNGVTIDAETGDLSWDVPEDYLGNKAIKYQTNDVVVKATSRIKQEDGSWVDGYSVEKTIDMTIVNSNYEAGEAPQWKDVANAETKTGEKFHKTVEATVGGDLIVEYQLTDCPKGMTIDQDGVIEWNVPSNFFESDAVKSTTVTVKLSATTLINAKDNVKDYGESSETSFQLTIVNSNFKDYAPVFKELEENTAVTGDQFSVKIEATDPNSLADRVYLELVGDDYPKDLAFSATGELVWTIPSDYLTKYVGCRKVSIEIKATEQYLGEDGVYTDGLTSTHVYDIYVLNGEAKEDDLVIPTWSAIGELENVVPGDSFELNVKAEAVYKPAKKDSEDKPADGEPDPGEDVPQEDYEYEVEYAIVKGPEGMTIDENGRIKWDVPADYFADNNVKSETIEVELSAATIMVEKGRYVDYGGEATTSFKLTIDNPDYKDNPPVFEELETVAAATGKTYVGQVVAKDPEGVNPIKYELIGEGYPAGFTFDPVTGAVSWAIPEEYLPLEVSAQTFKFTIKATERVKQEDGSLADGLSSEKTYELLIANSRYKDDEGVAPVIEKIDPQSVKAGETFTVTVEAKAEKEIEKDGKKETVKYEVEYSLADGMPEGMTIDSKTGVITWDVPKDYFNDLNKKEDVLEIKVNATTIVSREGTAVNYGEASAASFTLTVKEDDVKPDPDPEISNWYEWFDAWVANEQQRNESHSTNLSTYLQSYLAAVDVRKAELAKAKESYAKGETTLTEFLQKRDEIVDDYNDAVTEARKELADADAKTDAAADERIKELNSTYDKLAENKELSQPGDIKADAQEAAKDAVKKDVAAASGNANFRLSNAATGAKVATDLTSVLKLWREGYSYSTIYDEVYSDELFTQDAGEATDDKPTSDDKKEDDKKEDDKPTSDDKKEDEEKEDDKPTSDDKKEDEEKEDDKPTSDDKKEDEEKEDDKPSTDDKKEDDEKEDDKPSTDDKKEDKAAGDDDKEEAPIVDEEEDEDE